MIRVSEVTATRACVDLPGKLICLLLSITLVAGCGHFVSSATDRFAQNLSLAMLNQQDPETVKQAMPAYLLLIDSMIEGNPDNPEKLFAAAKMYGSYAGAFVDDPQRAKTLGNKAWDLAKKALCLTDNNYCGLHALPYDEFSSNLEKIDQSGVEVLYDYAVAWITWIQINAADDWNATADVPKVTIVMRQIIQLDDTYNTGAAHLYMGVLSTLLPPAVGGKPEQGRKHFERAIEISNGRNLMAKVLFAKHYARMVFNKKLHDEVLTEVINAKTDESGFTLMNVLAQKQAKALLASSKEYF